jgi:hypothetical protein
MINNKELILPLLNFEQEGDFYMLYIFKRKKDFPELEQQNHQSVRTIKTYCIESVEYLEKRWDEIVALSEMFKARVYIHVQKQNHKDVSLNMMMELAQRIKDGVTNQKNLFDSVVGQLKTYEKRWVVDVDSKSNGAKEFQINIINACEPIGNKILSTIPTKNGIHLITSPFNVIQYQDKILNLFLTGEDFFQADIQKKNPTLLYFPNSLEN